MIYEYERNDCIGLMYKLIKINFSEEVFVVEAGCGAGGSGAAGSEAAGFGATSCRLVLRGREQVAVVVLEDCVTVALLVKKSLSMDITYSRSSANKIAIRFEVL